jgi:hypothetical protein
MIQWELASTDEKREEIAFLNEERRRLDNLATNSNGNKNDNDIEIYYATGSWQNVIPYKMKWVSNTRVFL